MSCNVMYIGLCSVCAVARMASTSEAGFLQLATSQAISCQLHPVLYMIEFHTRQVSVLSSSACVIDWYRHSKRYSRLTPRNEVCAVLCVLSCVLCVQVVMFQVLDHHTRRNAEEGRVVGALLGSVGSDGTVQLKNAFPMNHDDVTHSPQAQVQRQTDRDAGTDTDTGAGTITVAGRGNCLHKCAHIPHTYTLIPHIRTYTGVQPLLQHNG
jgi:hypothetical protein